MIKEIEIAFKGVTRVGGVSWSETRVIDSYGSKEERDAARAADKDTTWLEVANDPSWRIDQGVGGYVFLDPIGFRYYLAAGMVKVIRGAASWPIQFRLRSEKQTDPATPNDQWSKLDAVQRACVKHFIKHMIQRTNNTYDQQDWKNIYDAYWKHVPEVRMRKR